MDLQHSIISIYNHSKGHSFHDVESLLDIVPENTIPINKISKEALLFAQIFYEIQEQGLYNMLDVWTFEPTHDIISTATGCVHSFDKCSLPSRISLNMNTSRIHKWQTDDGKLMKIRIVKVSPNLLVATVGWGWFYIPSIIMRADLVDKMTFEYMQKFVVKNIEQLKRMNTMENMMKCLKQNQQEEIMKHL